MEIITQHCLCFPADLVYMPLDVHKEEYIKSDYGLVYMGTNLNVMKQPWLFGQVCDNKPYAL